jgi:hypothetical protein
MTALQKWAMGGVFITTIMIALTGFITSGITEYQVSSNFQDGEMDKLEELESSTSIAKDAQQRAEQAEARSNFFTLPNIVNLLRLPFEAVPLWESFVGVTISVTGLSYAHGQWITTMFGSFALIAVAFAFAKRVL